MPRLPPPGEPEPWLEGQSAIYHITDLENLPSIVNRGQLLCDRQCEHERLLPVSIAYRDLKQKRARTAVTVGPKGTLAEYVPFYFAPRSPMLYVNSLGGVNGYSKGQDHIIHLVACAESCATEGDFVIIDGHPISPLSKQFTSLDALDRIDWSIMEARYWRDTDEDGDRKRRRQAEFLVHRSVGIEQVRLIGVKSAAVAESVQAALASLSPPPPVAIRRDWYY